MEKVPHVPMFFWILGAKEEGKAQTTTHPGWATQTHLPLMLFMFGIGNMRNMNIMGNMPDAQAWHGAHGEREHHAGRAVCVYITKLVNIPPGPCDRRFRICKSQAF